MMDLWKQVLAQAEKRYGVTPDAPFAKDKETQVLRHTDNKKWFALKMVVPARCLGLDGSEAKEIMNVKSDPALSGSWRSHPGILPAYHMNKEKWLSVLLDGSVPAAEVMTLLEQSYDLTKW